MRDRFAGKSVLITGASSGIGEALAREFAGRGAAIALLGRRTDRLDALAGELRGTGRRAIAVPCDVTHDGDLEAAVARATGEFGRLDVAVANAGFGVVGNVADLSLDDYRRQFETNVFGVLRTVHAVLGPLTGTRGTLVLIGSVSGHLAAPGASAYSMSKFAVRALAGALRGELAPRGRGRGAHQSGVRRQRDPPGGQRRPVSPGSEGADPPAPPHVGRESCETDRPCGLETKAGARDHAARQARRECSARHTPRLVAWLLERARVSRPEPGRTGPGGGLAQSRDVDRGALALQRDLGGARRRA